VGEEHLPAIFAFGGEDAGDAAPNSAAKHAGLGG